MFLACDKWLRRQRRRPSLAKTVLSYSVKSLFKWPTMSGDFDHKSRHDVDLVVDKSVEQNRSDTDSKTLLKLSNALQESMNTPNKLLSSLVAKIRHTSSRKRTVECFFQPLVQNVQGRA